MLERFFNYIKNIFNKNKIATSTKQQEENQGYADEYMDTSNVNFTALFANKLATKTLADSTVSIPENNKRAELLNSAVKAVFDKMKKITASALAVGGCIIVPYVKNGKFFFAPVLVSFYCA